MEAIGSAYGRVVEQGFALERARVLPKTGAPTDRDGRLDAVLLAGRDLRSSSIRPVWALRAWTGARVRLDGITRVPCTGASPRG